jgi:hypothetical protein
MPFECLVDRRQRQPPRFLGARLQPGFVELDHISARCLQVALEWFPTE